ncbi:thiol-disulfide oxidoreductase DCC family protein [Aggregatilineales bacterium SYSU G02658]
MTQAVVLFDGVCNLCTGAVQFIIKRDPKGRFRFAALQSDYAQALLRKHNLNIPLDGRDDTVALVEDGRVYTHSDAGLRIARHLSGPVRLAAPLIIVPRFIRDTVYRLIARHRYRIFGRQDTCWMPTPELRARFLDQS